MVSICVSARITDGATIQILALAYRNQIRHGNTWLFAERGKPWKALELSSGDWAAVARGVAVTGGGEVA
jgi:hypothetical protein